MNTKYIRFFIYLLLIPLLLVGLSIKKAHADCSACGSWNNCPGIGYCCYNSYGCPSWHCYACPGGWGWNGSQATCAYTGGTCDAGCYICPAATATPKPTPTPNKAPSCNSISGVGLLPRNTASNFTVNGSDSDGSVNAYSWSNNGGSPTTSGAQTITWSALHGNYTLNAQVRDDDGSWSGWCSKAVTVANPIICNIISPSSPSPIVINRGDAVSFTTSANPPNFDEVNHKWLLNGTTVIGTNSPTVTWTSPANLANDAPYTLTDTLTDRYWAPYTATCPSASVLVHTGYNFTVHVRLRNYPETSCTLNNVPLPQANVTISDAGSPSTKYGTGKTDVNGNFTATHIPINRNSLLILTSYTDPTKTCVVYDMYHESSTGTCDLTSGNLTVTLSNPQSMQPYDTTMVAQKAVGTAWITATDADVYAHSISFAGSCTGQPATGGFNTTLINLKNGWADKGYAFSKGTIGTAIISSSPSGFAKNLATQTSSLDKLSFTAPSGSEVANDFTALYAGRVYTMPASTFNTALLNPTTYRVIGNGVAILYVSGDININSPLTSFDTHRLLIITNGTIHISKNLANTLPFWINSIPTASPNYSLPQIQAAMLAKKEIIFDSAAPAADLPLKVEGPLMSASQIQFNRSLITGNYDYPAVTVEYNPIYLTTLTYIMPTRPTGINHFDIQWNYGY